MARKNYYYVLVLTDEGAKFVTEIQHDTRIAVYNGTAKPMEFGSKQYAEDIAMGLTANFNLAYAITSHFPIEHQPFRYEEGKFEWHWNKK